MRVDYSMSMRSFSVVSMVVNGMKMERGEQDAGQQEIGDNGQLEERFQPGHGTHILIPHLTSVVHTK
jgi:hypothetical protein